MSDRAVAAPADVLVGRDAEVALLEAALADARAGRGRLVALTGPPGIGKTRLAEEIAAIAERADVPVYWTRCTDEPGAPPMWPWLRLLTLSRAGTAAVDEALAASPTTVAEGQSARFRLIDAVTSAVLDGGPDDSAVLVLEDAHWADDLSLRVLRHLATSVSSARRLLVVTARDGSGPLAEVLDDAAGQRGVAAVRLRVLDRSDVVSYLHAAAGAALPAELLRAVQVRTGGLPLLVKAAATVLADAGRAGVPLAATPDSELWRRMSDGTDVRRLVTTSLAQLDQPARELVVTAAVLGEHIDVDLLAATVGAEPTDVHRRLTAAAAVHLVEVSTGVEAGYRFGHALVRDAVAAQLDPASVAEAHRRAAEAIEEQAGDDSVRAARAASHWLLAGTDPATSKRAAATARDAAAVASRRFAHEEAVSLLEQAVRALDRAAADPVTRAEALTELATAQFLSGAVGAATASTEAAFEYASRTGRGDLAAAAALVVHGIGRLGTSVSALRLADAALRDESLPAAVRARLHARRASALDSLDRFGEVGPASEMAMQLAEESDDDMALLDAAWARSAALVEVDDVPERMRIGALVVDRARQVGQPILEIFGHEWRIDAHYAAADLAAVDREIAEVVAIGDRQGLPLARWHALRLQASRAAFVGDFDRGLELSSAAYDLAVDVMEVPSLAGLSWAHRSEVDMIRGVPTRPPVPMRATITGAPQNLIIRLTQLLLLANEGRLDEARAGYEAVLARLHDQPRDSRWGGSLGILCQLAGMLADAAGAARLYREMVPRTVLAGSSGGATVIQTGSPHRVAADMAALAGLRTEAEEHYRRAIAVDGAMGARPMLALDRIGLAEVLLANDSAGNGAAASAGEVADLLRQGAAEARRLGMPGATDRCDRALTRLAAVTDARRRAADPLTPREREIALLIAESLSNRQVADRLVLSERTVETHVRNILAKLGFTRRTEIVSWALRD